MKSTQVQLSHITQTVIPFHKPFRTFPIPWLKSASRQGQNNRLIKSRSFPGSIKAIATSDQEKSTSVKAVVMVKVIAGGLLSNLGITRGLDDITDLFGKSVLLELVSTELDASKYLYRSSAKPSVLRID